MKKTVNRTLIAALLVLFYLRFIGGDGIIGGDAPFPADQLSVLVVEETEDRDDTPRPQNVAINSTIWREYVIGKGGAHRVLPPNHDTSKEDQWVQAAMKVERESIPWLVVSDGKTGFSEPMPDDLDGFMAKLKKVGGE